MNHRSDIEDELINEYNILEAKVFTLQEQFNNVTQRLAKLESLAKQNGFSVDPSTENKKQIEGDTCTIN